MASNYGKRYPGSGSVIEAEWKSGKKKGKKKKSKAQKQAASQAKAKKQAKREERFEQWQRSHRGKVIRSSNAKTGTVK